MKYVMLIYQGTALERQAALPEEEQKQVCADYQRAAGGARDGRNIPDANHPQIALECVRSR